MTQDRTRNLLVSLALAGLIATLASLGGDWGNALGQTAGPPPTRIPAGAPTPTQPVITPPPATEYRPAPRPAPSLPTSSSTGATAPAATSVSAPTRALPDVTATSTRPTAAPAGSPVPQPTAQAATRAVPEPQEGGMPVLAVVGGVAVAGLAGFGLWWLRRP